MLRRRTRVLGAIACVALLVAVVNLETRAHSSTFSGDSAMGLARHSPARTGRLGPAGTERAVPILEGAVTTAVAVPTRLIHGARVPVPTEEEGGSVHLATGDGRTTNCSVPVPGQASAAGTGTSHDRFRPLSL